jgi:hypothetical protein
MEGVLGWKKCHTVYFLDSKNFVFFTYYCSIKWTEGFRMELVPHCLFSGQQKCGHLHILLFHNVDGRGL